ncbi:MAG TPA: MarR family winged helix-turn-helix transcriptional regulator [Solirubrobacteraceae bacterium]|jgi:DNA-binding MarR family transcriptional regulator|nr:MarR family winged helix-turn-helix transcriptional regulator [Solirubrobacteraceae bacterium]
MAGEGEARVGTRPVRLGGALRQAWEDYRRRLDQELAAAGFGDRGFPDGRVLRLCGGASDVTISHIGRELGITRQGASKIVASLRDRGYVTLSPSPTDGREKLVKPTRRAVEFLAAQREAARRIEARIRSELGPDALDGLYRLLDALGTEGEPPPAGYVRGATSATGLWE